MPNDDLDIDAMEREFPLLASHAFATARKNTLAAGLSVLESDNGALYEVFPDGRRRFVKALEPPIPVVVGTKIRLK